MAKVGVLLSGCGVYDGAEIHESVITLLALDRAGAEIVCMAPDVDQMHVVDHRTGDVVEERRNVLTESARIARGDIRDLAEVGAGDIDALILPGGLGAAKNLCDFAVAGSDARTHPEVARLLDEMLAAKKPVGVVCIAPAVMAAVLRDTGRSGRLTIGTDEATAANLERMGVIHVPCKVEEICVDAETGVVSTPAYMLAGRISEAATGIERLVAEVLARVGAPEAARSR
ncbi:MAG: isoprenoid biosynthesis glyoxalase ElbB [Planctomycetota bacterium]|nr:isoprenoid biosynthesis glyoxalase ElbB [Planctomycetota bacterium]